MKLIVCIGLVCCLAIAAQALSHEEKMKLELNLLESCKGKEGANDADIKGIMERDLPTTKGGKCLLACAHETLELVQNGKVSTENAIKVAKMAHAGEDEEKISNGVKELVGGCANIPNTERCEFSAKLMECIQAAAKAKGLDPKKLL